MPARSPAAVGFIATAALCVLAFGGTATAQTIRVGHVNTVSDAGIYIADAKGYFKEEGITVELTAFTTAALMVAPLGAGQLDIGGGTVAASLYNAAARDIGIKIVADKGSIRPGYVYSTLVVRKDLVESGRYKSLADLKGLKIGVSAYGTGNAATLNAALVLVGLKWSDAESVQLGFPQQYTALANKAIDGAIINEPLLSLAIKQGVAVKDRRDAEIYPEHQNAVVLYATDFVKRLPATAAKFMRAYLRGVRDFNDALKDGHLAGPNADEVIKVLIGATDVKDASVYRETSPSALDPDGKVIVESLRRDLDFFKEQKLIEKADITADSMLDMSFAESAVKDLGPYKRKE
jgi:NitT/TauT family transport system substrate-binding protein